MRVALERARPKSDPAKLALAVRLGRERETSLPTNSRSSGTWWLEKPELHAILQNKRAEKNVETNKK